MVTAKWETAASGLPDEETLAAMLRRVRVTAGLSQEALAEKSGLSAKGIAQLETGKRTAPRAETLRMLADALALATPERSALALAARRGSSVQPALHAIPGDEPNPGAAKLPRPLTSCIGREREVAAICELLAKPDVRLVTLTGPGGVGKTRLATQVLEQRGDELFDAIVFVPLAAVRDPDLVAPTIAQAVGVPNTPDQPLLVRIYAFLEQRHTLLVLDNLEHLLESGPFVAELIAHCETLTVLCTSRSRLNLSAEQVFPVQSLSADASISLFEQRTQATSPGFDLGRDLIPTIDAICQRLDRLPLAIELAAARITVLPPQALLARLRHPLALLTEGPQDLPDRQRTMRNVIAWSYNLLPDDEQSLFRRLGAFVDGLTLEAAGSVAGGGDVLSGLESLVRNSLLNTIPGVSDSPRFAMLETIREFALEQLAACGEESIVRHRHASHFAHAMESELPNQDGPDLRATHDRIEADLPNCRAAMAWTVDMNEAGLGIRLAGALWRTWLFGQEYRDRPWQERMHEGRAWLDKTLRLREGLPISVLAEAMAGAAQLAVFSDDFTTAMEFTEELEVRARAESFQYGMFWAMWIRGDVALAHDDFDTARQLYEQAAEATGEIRNSESALSQVRQSLGINEELRGNLSDALAHFEHALELGRMSGNPYAVSGAAFNAGRLSRIRGDLHRSALLLGEALRCDLGQRNSSGAGHCLAELAEVALKSGYVERAVAFLAVGQPLHVLPILQPTTDKALISAPLDPFHPMYRHTRDETMAKAHLVLGTDVFGVAWETGTRMSWDEIVAEIAELTHDLEMQPSSVTVDRRRSRTA